MEIRKTTDESELREVWLLMGKWFREYELVSLEDFIYYAREYKSLYPGEEYFVYRIENEGELIGMLSGLLLDEFILIDYFLIDEASRKSTFHIMDIFMDIFKEYEKPVVVEAETEVLCRLYGWVGFQRFKEDYSYTVVKKDDSRVRMETHKSNLMFRWRDDMDYEETRRILSEKYYIRWYSKYGEEVVRRYREVVNM